MARYRTVGPLFAGAGSRAQLALQLPEGDAPAEPRVLIPLHADVIGSEEALEAVRRETRRAVHLHHPHITRVFGLTQESIGLCRVVEYVDGESVRSLLELSGPLPPDLAVRIAADAALGVHYAHVAGNDDGTPLIHGDLRPETLMVTYSGLTKVGGYGALAAAPREARGRRVRGRRQHCAPEQVVGGRQAVNVQSDVYLLGVLLYELLSGNVPFLELGKEFDHAVLTYPPPPLPVGERPPGLEPVVQKAMAKKAQDRYPSALAFRDALEQALGAFVSHDALAAKVARLFPQTFESRRAVRMRMLETALADLSGTAGMPRAAAHARAMTPGSAQAASPGRNDASRVAPATTPGGTAASMAPTTTPGRGAASVAPTTTPGRGAASVAPTATPDRGAVSVAPTTTAARDAASAVPVTTPGRGAPPAAPVTTPGRGAASVTPATTPARGAASHAPATTPDRGASSISPPAPGTAGNVRASPATADSAAELAATPRPGAPGGSPAAPGTAAAVVASPTGTEPPTGFAATARPSSLKPSESVELPPRKRRRRRDVVLTLVALGLLAIGVAGYTWLRTRIPLVTVPSADRPVAPSTGDGGTAVAAEPPVTATTDDGGMATAAMTPPDGGTALALLELFVDPPVEVTVDGEPMGRTPAKLRVAPGRRQLRFVDRVRGISTGRVVEVPPQGTAREFYLSRGYINVFAPEGAEVVIDGRPYGAAPLREVGLYEGSHRIVVTIGTAKWQEAFDLAPNQRLRFDVDFE